MTDRRLKVCKIAEIVGNSKVCVFHTLHKILAIVPSRRQMEPCDYFRAVFEETVYFMRRNCSKEREASSIGQKSVGYRFLEFAYLLKGKTVTQLCCVELLPQTDIELQKKQPHLVKKKSVFPPESLNLATYFCF